MKQTATQVVKTLQDAGFQAVFAGGCVRDMLLNRVPNDYDVATDATPDQVEKLFDKTVAVGKSFGVVVVLKNSFEVEVATFRNDGQYSDGRHPENVTFSTMEKDAKRRDFTMNALFLDPVTNVLYDFVNGEQDLKDKVLKFVGDPYNRLTEDKLRMLRTVRFAARYGFTVDPNSWDAVKQNADQIDQVSNERVFSELTKMFVSNHPDQALDLLYEAGLLQEVLPEVFALKKVEQGLKYHWREARVCKLGSFEPFEPFDPNNSEHLDPEKYVLDRGDTFVHTKLVMTFTRPDPVMRWGALLHDVGKPSTFRMRKGNHTFYGHEEVGEKLADKVLRRFKTSNEFRAAVTYLVRDHMRFFNVSKMKTATLKRMFREPFYLDLQELHKADVQSSDGNLAMYEYAVEKYAELSKSLKLEPLLSGYDLMALGLKPGPVFKKLLRDVETLQLENKLTTKDQALEYVKEHNNE